MSEEFRRFLLRHRVPIGGALVMIVLAVLTILTLAVRRGGEESGGSTARVSETVSVPARVPSPPVPQAETPPLDRPPPRPEPETPPATPARPRSLAPDSPGPGPLPERDIAADLGELTGVLSPQESTTILGGVSLRLEGGRLHWKVRVIENGVTHVGMGLQLGALGGAGQYWVAAPAGEHEPGAPFWVAGVEEVPPALADALRRAADAITVEIAGYRVGPSSRVLTASDTVQAPLDLP